MDKNVFVSKLDRLTALRDLLLQCCVDSVNYPDEWLTFRGWSDKVNDMISAERRNLGYMAVYPIVDGCSKEALFEGTSDECKIYVDVLLENNPDMRDNIIVLDL